MGNTCEADDLCGCPGNETGKEMREKLASSSKISQKDMVKIKNYPISQDYVILSPHIGKGSFGTVHKIVNKTSGMIWAAKKIPITKSMDKYFQ